MSIVADQTVPDVPSVTDPAFYSRTCSDLHLTQDRNGLRPYATDDEVRAFLASRSQEPWWKTLDLGRQETYVQALRDFAAGKC